MILLINADETAILNIYEPNFQGEYPLMQVMSDRDGNVGSKIRYYHLYPNNLLVGDSVPALSLAKNIEFFAKMVWDLAIMKEAMNMTGSGPSVILLGTLQSNLKAAAVNQWVQVLYGLAGSREDTIKAVSTLDELDAVQLDYNDYPDKPYKIREIAAELGLGG